MFKEGFGSNEVPSPDLLPQLSGCQDRLVQGGYVPDLVPILTWNEPAGAFQACFN